MTRFVDMLDPNAYDYRNVVESLCNGSYSRDSLRERLVHVNAVSLAVEHGFRRFCAQRGFTETKVPNIVSTIGACENWRTLFKVDHDSSFFHLLAQTGQLFLEGALAHHSRVCCITKSFRKEAIEDQRHLVEFTLLEIEGAFVFDELLSHMQHAYHAMCEMVLSEVPAESVRGLGMDLDHVREQGTSEITVVPYSECVTLADGLAWGDDLGPEVEQLAIRKEGNGKAPILITRFPKAIKFFNMAEDPFNHDQVLSVDLVLPVAGESAGGAQREHNAAKLKQRLLDSDMYNHHIRAGGTYEDFAPYVDMIERGLTPIHSGCGFGCERVVQALLAEPDIRLCSTDYLTRMLYAWDALRLGKRESGETSTS